MNIVFKYILSLFILCLSFGIGESRHIIGGEITYTCAGPGALPNTMNWTIIMNLYRDCSGGGAQFDNPAEFGIYRKDSVTGRLVYFSSFLQANGAINEISGVENPCLILPPNICVQGTKYEFTLSNMEIFGGSYVITYVRCCRNESIANIYTPGDFGATYTVEITSEAQRTCNNSPVFNELPPILICGGEELNYDHSAFDEEGDQLVYEFCGPLVGGGQNFNQNNPSVGRQCNGIMPDPRFCPPTFRSVEFIVPTYSALRPMGGNPVVSINPNTGLITGTPNILGQYVVGICVKEYRNGKLLTELRRDFQFNVAQCERKVFAQVAGATKIEDQSYEFVLCGENTIDLINESYQQSFIQSYYWEFDIDGDIQTFTTPNISVTFPNLGAYPGKMILNRGIDCTDSMHLTINVNPSIDADFEFVYDTCVAGPTSFTDLSETGADMLTDWNWHFGEGGMSEAQNPDYVYRDPGNHPVKLTVTDNNNCSDSLVKIIDYNPVPALIIIEPSTFLGCSPENVFFNNLSFPIDSTYDITWDLGDGNTAFDVSPRHVYEDPGVYSVRLDITSPAGCSTSASFPGWIEVRQSPTAEFSFIPEQPNSSNSTVTFTNLSQNENAWLWQFGQYGNSVIEDPVFMFPDTGSHEITLIVSHNDGCLDTFVQIIDVEPLISYFLPNAFTPNNDDVNDVYLGKGVLSGITDFNFSIWNRWGEMIFQTKNPTEGWNGKKHNSGGTVPNGVYLAIVSFTGPRGDKHKFESFATVIR